MNVDFSDSSVPIPWQRHMRWQWLGDRICMGYLCKVESKIPQWLKQFGTCWQHKSSEMSSPCVWTSISTILRCLFLVKDTCDGSGWETDYVWGTCVKCNPKYLNDWSSLAQVDSIKAVKCRALVYKRRFQRFFGTYSLTNTHAMVGRQNMYGVTV